MKDNYVETKEAAELLHRRPQTLRAWASNGKGPLKPIRINGARSRLLWRLSDIERILEIKRDEETSDE